MRPKPLLAAEMKYRPNWDLNSIDSHWTEDDLRKGRNRTRIHIPIRSPHFVSLAFWFLEFTDFRSMTLLEILLNFLEKILGPLFPVLMSRWVLSPSVSICVYAAVCEYVFLILRERRWSEDLKGGGAVFGFSPGERSNLVSSLF